MKSAVLWLAMVYDNKVDTGTLCSTFHYILQTSWIMQEQLDISVPFLPELETSLPVLSSMSVHSFSRKCLVTQLSLNFNVGGLLRLSFV